MTSAAVVTLVSLLALLSGCAGHGPAGAGSPTCASPCEDLVAAPGGHAWEPSVAVDPLDPGHIVAGLTRVEAGPAVSFASDIIVAVSRDGGRSWTNTTLPHGKDVAPGDPFATATALGDPIVAFLPEGTLLVSGLAYAPALTDAAVFAQGFRIFVARSTDGGRSFQPATILAEDRGAAMVTPAGYGGVLVHAPDRPLLTVGADGTCFFSWRWVVQATPARPQRSVLSFSTSTDGARTWSAPADIETGTVNALPGQAVVDAPGSFLLAYGGWEGTRSPFQDRAMDAWLARTTDGGAHWAMQRLGPGAWFPQLGRSADGLLAVYPVRVSDGHEVVTMRVSRDDGATFEPPVALASPEGSGQTIPTLATDGARAYLTYYDARAGGSADLRALFVRAAATPPSIVLAANVTSDPGALGEYFGLAARPGGAYAVWATESVDGRFSGAAITGSP